jgi:hypothetical protein
MRSGSRSWLPNRSSLRILRISWLPSRSSFAEASVASLGRAVRPPRAAGFLLARAEELSEEDQQEGGKSGSKTRGFARCAHRATDARDNRLSSPARSFCSLPREIFLVLVLQKQKCALAFPQVFPSSRLPVDLLSLAQNGPEPPQKLLRFRLQFGSQDIRMLSRSSNCRR